MSPSEHRVSLHYQENNPFSRDLIKNYSMLVEIMIYSVLIQDKQIKYFKNHIFTVIWTNIQSFDFNIL